MIISNKLSDKIFANEPNKIFIPKVKEYCNIHRNEVADSIEKKGVWEN